LNQAKASLLADALESGHYLKGKGKLVAKTGTKGTNVDRAFSVTGVMAQLATAGGYTHRKYKKTKKGSKYGYTDSTFSGCTTGKGGIRTVDIPNSVCKFFGMQNGNTKIRGGIRVGGRTYSATLEQLNDTGVNGKSWGFPSLAKLIRSRYADIG
jgi:hypothetical protein